MTSPFAKFLFVIIFLGISNITFGQVHVLPTPSVARLLGGKLEGRTMRLVTSCPDNAKSLLEREFSYFNWSFENDSNAIDVTFSHSTLGQSEFYEIDIREHITINYSSDAMAFYAVTSLIQLAETLDERISLPRIYLRDEPKYQWRGLHLDVSRHFFTVEEVKKFIDVMSLYKFNKFHWHLTDDQGWRIQIDKYPLLTQVGSYRDSTLLGHYDQYPKRYEKVRYGGYYTKDEIREVIRYAAERHVEVIPEIELPGHSRAALAAYPNLSCTGDTLPVPGTWGVFEDIFCSKEETIRFLQDVLKEVIELFPGDYIHIGGDEAPKTRWISCENCQQVKAQNGLRDEHELQSYVIGRMDAFLSAHNKKLIGWDEILEGGLSRNAIVMSWRGQEGGIQSAKSGHQVIMAPTTHCYFDYYQSSHPAEPMAIGGFLPLEKVYEFNPRPTELTEEEAQFILGGQANLWTEYIAGFDHLMYMAYPRALALIETLWSHRKQEYSEFLSNITAFHEDYLKRHGVKMAQSIHYPSIKTERIENGIGIHLTGADSTAVYEVVIDRKFKGKTQEMTQTLRSGEVFPIAKAADNEEVYYTFKISSQSFDGQLVQHCVNHNLIGIPVILETEPHPMYNQNGSLTLVDGIRGGRPWKGQEYLGYRDTLISFRIDLDRPERCAKFKLGLLESPGSWIYLPTEIEIHGGKKEGKMKQIGTSGDRNDFDGSSWEVKCKPRKVRFLEVTIRTMKRIPEGMNGAGYIPWTFIDELEVDFKSKK